jgi:uncharacterized protein (DUF362 family)
MRRPTRREFLQGIAAAGGLAAAGPLARWAGAAGAEPAPAAMSIARWSGAAAPETDLAAAAARLTKEAIGALGGMSRFVSRGDVVWVKPNIGWNRAPELAATTNPDVVAELVRLCLEAGAKTVKVGDNTCHDARQSYATSGIERAARAAGAEIVFLDDDRYRDVALNGRRLKTWPLYPEIIEADLVINVPIAKDHGLSNATLCMKNYMGIIGGRRSAWHQDIAACLCDVTAYMKPRLCVVDAVRVLTAHGPQGGSRADVKRLDTVAAGVDIVALDAFGAELLGLEPARLKTVRAAHDAGLGTMAYKTLAPREIAVS